MHRGQEIQQPINEVHTGTYIARQTSLKLKMQIKKMWYYWPTINTGCIDFAWDAKYVNTKEMYTPTIRYFMSNNTFLSIRNLGIDIIALVEAGTVRGYKSIFAATEYISKWAEIITVRFH